MFFDVSVRFGEGVVVEVKFVVTELSSQAVLVDIGFGHRSQRARAERVAERLKHDLNVVFGEHGLIINGYNAVMKFYTTKGDDGTTGLLGKGRVSKYHARIEAIGALDESTAAMGLARAQCLDARSAPIILEAQRDLYKLMAEVAATPENEEKFRSIDAARVTWLEEQTDALSEIVQMPKEFILPGDSPASAALSLARTIVRRAERRVVELHDAGEVANLELQRYLNRLSSLCFVLELLENEAAGRQTTLAKR